jgi:hypothetical protein
MEAGLLRPEMEELPDKRLFVVLDTTVLWNGFCAVADSWHCICRRGNCVSMPGGSWGWRGGCRWNWRLAERERGQYGLRFAIEEGFLNHNSGGFQWAAAKLAMSRPSTALFGDGPPPPWPWSAKA